MVALARREAIVDSYLGFWKHIISVFIISTALFLIKPPVSISNHDKNTSFYSYAWCAVLFKCDHISSFVGCNGYIIGSPRLPFRPQTLLRGGKKPRNFPFVTLWPNFLFCLVAYLLHYIILQFFGILFLFPWKEVLHITSSSFFFFMEVVHIFYFLCKRIVTKWLILCFTLTSCGDLVAFLYLLKSWWQTRPALSSWTIEALLFRFTVFCLAATKAITHVCAFC